MLQTFIFNLLIVTLAVLIHYEFLHRVSTFIPEMKIKHRYRVVFGVFGALFAHSIEIGLFASAYYYFDQSQQWGYLRGNFDGSFMDCAYYSFTTFTTLGFGDIIPFGSIRILTGLESLTGLVLITWSASFLYYEMQRHWGQKN